MQLWRPLPVTEHPTGGFQALHEYLSPVDRPLSVLSAVSNLVPGPGSALITRPGLTLQGGGAIATAVVRGIHTFVNLAGTTVQVLAQAGAQLSRLNAGAWTSITAATTNANFSAGNINNLAVIFYPGAAAQSWDGTTLAALGGTPPQGGFCTVAYNQVFVAGMAGREGAVDFCDVGAPTTWAASATNEAGSITVGPEPITWLDFAQEQGQVIIWTRNTLHILHGPETPNRPTLWSVETADRYGTPAGRTVKRVAGRWIWLTDTGGIPGFALWSGGRVQVDRDPIRTSLGLIDWANIGNATAYLDLDGRYVCKVPATVGGMIDFIWDPKSGSWWTGISLDIRSAGTGRINGVDVPLVGDKDGKVYQASGTDWGGTAITWSTNLGPSLLGNTFREKRLNGVRLVLSLAAGATAQAATSTTESLSDWGTARTLTASTQLTQVPVAVPVVAGEAVRGAVLRVKVLGTGVVTLHDVLLRAYQGRN